MRIEGKLNPAPTLSYDVLAENLPSFSIKLDKEIVTAIPHTKVPVEEEAALLEQLQREISPLLTVLGSFNGRAIAFEITDVKYPNLKRFATALLINYSISVPVPSVEEIQQKIHWASVDPIYCDLLDFYTEVLAVPNPRPVAYKMVERLEKKFGNRNKACSELGIQDLKPIVADQSQYRGDRHAKYNERDVPARLNQGERLKILDLLKHIIENYEKRVCAVLS